MNPQSGALDSYLARQLAENVRRAAQAPPIESPFAGAGARHIGTITGAVAALAPELVALARDLHAHPELCFEERHAVGASARLLEQHGVEVEVGAFGLPTAFRARLGTGRPRVAILAEYDALPGMGHACGHNVICATAVGAFLALSPVLGEIDGSIELVGSPAEEGGGGKELIIDAGGFDAIDVAMMVHPANFDILDHPMLGFRQVNVSFAGRAAHASAAPFLGRNALDAVVTAYNAIAQLRQHMLPSDRIHGIITNGGKLANIVPDFASATFFVRSMEIETLAELYVRVQSTFEAAALATGTELDVHWDVAPPYLPLRSNAALGARFAVHAEQRGRRIAMGELVPGAMSASTDMGNVSQIVPSIHPVIGIAPPAVSPHMPTFAEHAIGAAADKGTLDGAVALAATAADYLADAALRAAVADEFIAAGGRQTVADAFGA